MALTYGFYNSLNGDRKYSAKQFGSIFDGVIHDGVYSSIGNRMVVQASGTGFQVNIQTGRAWFNHTWTLNDTVYPLNLPNPEPLLNKYVAVVLEVNEEQGQRRNSFQYVAGTPASAPTYPTLINTSTVHQYPLAYCLVKAGATKITQAEITNMVGTSQCPYVSGVVSSFNIDELIAQWREQYTQWYNANDDEFTTFMSNSRTAFNEFMIASHDTFDTFMDNAEDTYDTWWAEFTTDATDWLTQFESDSQDEFDSFMTASRNEYHDFMYNSTQEFDAFMDRIEPAFDDFIDDGDARIDDMLSNLGTDFETFWNDFQNRMNTYLTTAQSDISDWFDHIKGQLSTDAATHLQEQIDAIKYIYVSGNRVVIPNTAASISGSRLILSTP